MLQVELSFQVSCHVVAGSVPAILGACVHTSGLGSMLWRVQKVKIVLGLRCHRRVRSISLTRLMRTERKLTRSSDLGRMPGGLHGNHTQLLEVEA